MCSQTLKIASVILWCLFLFFIKDSVIGKTVSHHKKKTCSLAVLCFDLQRIFDMSHEIHGAVVQPSGAIKCS